MKLALDCGLSELVRGFRCRSTVNRGCSRHAQ